VPTVSTLPGNADLDHLRGQARTLQRGVRAGDPDAVRRVRAQYGEVSAPESFPLSAAQLVLAREYGFAGWPRLRRHLDTVARYRWDPADPGTADLGTADARTADPRAADPAAAERPADRFCRLACLDYTDADRPERREQAAALLAADPALVRTDIHAAAAAGDPDALRRHLAADPTAARRPGGPYGWRPLFQLLYSRVPAVDAVASARLLLTAGADPHEGYLWRGLPTPFTLLTGAFGEGEQGPVNSPRHPDSLALARLLLDAGTDPADGQALYNRMFGPDDDHLRLLLEYGLGRGDGGIWKARLGEALADPAELLRDQLGWAVDHRYRDRVRLLVEHGVDVRSPFADGRTPVERARRAGDPAMVRQLLAHGAALPPPNPVDSLLGAAFDGDAATIAEHLSAAPAARRARPGAMVWAAAHGRPGALELLAGLGFDVNAYGRSDIPSDQPWHTPLHAAVEAGDTTALRTLLALGADSSLRDRRFDATPLDWARHLGQDAVARALEEHAEPGPGR
jgi:hypothetical protein